MGPFFRKKIELDNCFSKVLSGFSFKVLLFSVLTLLLMRCKEPAEKENLYSEQDFEKNREEIKKQFITANQQLMQKENDEMDYYGVSHKMSFVRTGSGVRYYVYKPSVSGDSIKDGSEVTIDFKIFTMDGTLCYSSETEGKRTFIIGQEEIESGIHKGLKYLKRGDKAILLIPSPLAHGLLGDFKKIPPQMPIVYYVQVE
jgi:FKBP-type peptidyl-prolyl cis-trans isomerase